jgi:hypothetical protein
MYPECRYVRPSGGTCNSPALKGSHWCYYHGGLQQRQAIRHSHRRADGRFLALPPSTTHSSSRPEPSRASETGEAEGSALPLRTIDYGTYPVGSTSTECHPERSEGPALHSASLDLPPLEDAVSIQLALIDVAQALAANRIDTKRAGLLLYALQVASTNVRNMHIPLDSVRSVTYTDDGAPLAPQDYGYDVEDYDNEDDEDDVDEEESESQ